MSRDLSELSKREWDTFFPIDLEEHDPNWKNIFKEERSRIIDKIGDQVLTIEHVGSTAIPGIKGKPYIDISIEILEKHLFDEKIIASLRDLNYSFFRQAGVDTDYMLFVKGYNLSSKKDQIYHIHMCPSGHKLLQQISFRDYLLNNPEKAQQYEELKTKFAVKFKNDRVGYRVAKDGFVKEVLSLTNS